MRRAIRRNATPAVDRGEDRLGEVGDQRRARRRRDGRDERASYCG